MVDDRAIAYRAVKLPMAQFDQVSQFLCIDETTLQLFTHGAQSEPLFATPRRNKRNAACLLQRPKRPRDDPRCPGSRALGFPPPAHLRAPIGLALRRVVDRVRRRVLYIAGRIRPQGLQKRQPDFWVGLQDYDAACPDTSRAQRRRLGEVSPVQGISADTDSATASLSRGPTAIQAHSRTVKQG